jgi:hypothetical protein
LGDGSALGPESPVHMSFLTHLAFSVMMLLALWAGIWSHQRCE